WPSGPQPLRQKLPAHIATFVQIIELPTNVGGLFAIEVMSGLRAISVVACPVPFDQLERYEGIEEIPGAAFGNSDIGSERGEVARPCGQHRENSKLDRTEQCFAGSKRFAKGHDAIGRDGHAVNDGVRFHWLSVAGKYENLLGKRYSLDESLVAA